MVLTTVTTNSGQQLSFVKINNTFKKWFNGLADKEKHTVVFNLNYDGDLKALTENLRESFTSVIEICAKELNLGVHKLLELYDDHEVPYMLCDLTLTHENESRRVHLGLEKSTLYVVVCSMGELEKVDDKKEVADGKKKEDVDEYFEICEKDSNGEYIRRFEGNIAKGVSLNYKKEKVKDMGFRRLKNTIFKICKDVLGLKDPKKRKNDLREHPVFDDIYYCISECSRFFFILDEIIRAFLGGIDCEVPTYFEELVLNWDKLSEAIRRVCEANQLEKNDLILDVSGISRIIANMKDSKAKVRVLSKRKCEAESSNARTSKRGKR